MKRFHIFTTFIILTVSLPIILTLLIRSEEFNDKENRTLQTKLDLDGVAFRKWPQKIDLWFNDSVSSRRHLVNCYLNWWDTYLDASVGQLVKGQEGDYFSNLWREVDKYLGLEARPIKKLRQIKYSIAATQACCQLEGIPYLCFYVPGKTTLYSEKLPFHCDKKNNSLFRKGRSWREEIFDYLKGTPINLVDLTPALEEGKKSARMYHYKYDLSHWNGYGLAVGYQFIKEKIKQIRPDLFLDSTNDVSFGYELIYNANDGEDEIRIKLLHPERYQVRNERVADFLPQGIKHKAEKDTWLPDYIINNEKKSGRLCLSTDSFFKHSINATLPGCHSKIAPFVDDFHEYLHFHFNWLTPNSIQEICKNYRPDFFVEEFVEHHVSGIIRKTDPYWLTLADFLLQTTSARVLSPQETPLASLPSSNASWTKYGDVLVFHSAGSESYINTDAFHGSNCRIMVNDDGLAVLIARIDSPADTKALWEVKLANDPNAKWAKKVFNMKKGLNHVRIEYEGNPGDVLEWKFTPGLVAGDYIFHAIPEAQQLRKNTDQLSTAPIQ
jgi:hypothetical protein